MDPLEVVTYGNGAILVDLFEAIARIRQGNFINGVFIVMMLCGFILSMIQNIVVFNPKALAVWTISWSVIFGLVYQPTRAVVISDMVIGGHATIDHIPLGLATFASVVSQAGSNLAEIFEDQLKLPNVERYTRTGTLMSSKLALAASQIQIITPSLETSFRNFAFQCIMYDVRMGARYTMNDLLYSNDPWGLIKGNTSQLRMFEYFGKNGKREVMVCHAGAQKLEADLNAEAGNNGKMLSWQLLNCGNQLKGRLFNYRNKAKNIPEGHAKVNDIIKDYLPASHEILAHMSGDSTAILKKHMVMNAIREAPIKNAQMLDVGAGAQGYAIARAKAQQQNTFQLLGSMAGSGVQNLMGLFEALFYGSFILIVLIAAMPGCQRILMSYVISLVWIQSWPTIYAIINFCMVSNATAASNAAASYVELNGEKGIGWNLFTSPAIIQANLDQAALAGFYSLSVPFIAIAVVKGVSSFVHLAGHLSSITQGAASQAGEELTTGNYALENIQYLNTSANNMNSNHWDTAPAYRASTSSYEMPSGSQMKVTGEGDIILDQSQGMSQLTSNLHLSQSFASRRNELFQESQNAYQQAGTSYVDSMGATLSSAMQYAKSSSQNMSEGTSYSQSEQEGNVKSLQALDSLSDKLAIQTGWSKQKSLNMLASLQVKPLDFVNKFGQAGKLLERGIGANSDSGSNGGSSIDLMLGGNYQYSRTDSSSWDKLRDFAHSENASETVEKAIRASKEMHSNMGTEKQDKVSEDFSAHMSSMENHERQFQVATQRMVSAQQAKEYSESNAANIDYNLNQEFVTWAADQIGPNRQKLGIEGVDKLLKTPNEANVYAQLYLDEQIGELKNQISHNATDVDQQYSKYASAMPSGYQIRNIHESDKSYIMDKAHEEGVSISNKTAFNGENKAAFEAFSAQNTQAMHEGEHSIAVQSDNIEERVDKKLGSKMNKLGEKLVRLSNRVKKSSEA